MSQHIDYTEILHTVLENIAYSKESNNETLYQLYPLTDTPRIQPVPRVHKNHLMGLFLELGLLFNRKDQLQSKGIDKWNALVYDKVYSFNQCRIRQKKVIELSVPPVTALMVKGKRNLTAADRKVLNDYFVCLFAFKTFVFVKFSIKVRCIIIRIYARNNQ